MKIKLSANLRCNDLHYLETLRNFTIGFQLAAHLMHKYPNSKMSKKSTKFYRKKQALRSTKKDWHDSIRKFNHTSKEEQKGKSNGDGASQIQGECFLCQNG